MENRGGRRRGFPPERCIFPARSASFLPPGVLATKAEVFVCLTGQTKKPTNSQNFQCRGGGLGKGRGRRNGDLGIVRLRGTRVHLVGAAGLRGSRGATFPWDRADWGAGAPRDQGAALGP